jgi:hypothetical protein
VRDDPPTLRQRRDQSFFRQMIPGEASFWTTGPLPYNSGLGFLGKQGRLWRWGRLSLFSPEKSGFP